MGNQPSYFSNVIKRAGTPTTLKQMESKESKESMESKKHIDNKTSISTWKCYTKDFNREAVKKLLEKKLNTYMFYKAPPLLKGDNLYIVAIYHDRIKTTQENYTYLLIQEESTPDGYRYMYVVPDMYNNIVPEPDHFVPYYTNSTWYGTWFNSVHDMIKLRFPTIVGPADLTSDLDAIQKPAGGRRRKTKKSNRISRHKYTKKRKCTMRRKQTRRTRH